MNNKKSTQHTAKVLWRRMEEDANKPPHCGPTLPTTGWLCYDGNCAALELNTKRAIYLTQPSIYTPPSIHVALLRTGKSESVTWYHDRGGDGIVNLIETELFASLKLECRKSPNSHSHKVSAEWLIYVILHRTFAITFLLFRVYTNWLLFGQMVANYEQTIEQLGIGNNNKNTRFGMQRTF